MTTAPMTLRGLLIIILSFFLALVFSIIPLNSWGELLRPQWLVLVVIYWVIALPHRIGLGIAWLSGLLLDALYGSLLGQHALAIAVVAYMSEKLHRQMRMFPVLQQAFTVLILLIIYQALLVWIQGMQGELANVRWMWLSTFVSMFLWPWFYLLLRACQRKFQIN